MSVQPTTSVIVDVTNLRRESQSHNNYLDYPSDTRQNSDYVFVNKAFSGSASSMTTGTSYCNPPTTVIREQYWACSKWSFAQRTLALAVGVLVGTVIGLVVIIIMKEDDARITNLINSPFSS